MEEMVSTPFSKKELFLIQNSGGDGNFLISSSCIGFTDMYGGCYPMATNGYAVLYRIGDDG